jgi:hypothetical protein
VLRLRSPHQAPTAQTPITRYASLCSKADFQVQLAPDSELRNLRTCLFGLSPIASIITSVPTSTKTSDLRSSSLRPTYIAQSKPIYVSAGVEFWSFNFPNNFTTPAWWKLTLHITSMIPCVHLFHWSPLVVLGFFLRKPRHTHYRCLDHP